jgi:hypothetical protein
VHLTGATSRAARSTALGSAHWPPQRRLEQRTEYRVQARLLEAGPKRGWLRLEADYRRTRARGWRQTAPDATISPEDRASLTAYFETVEASAAHREPAR